MNIDYISDIHLDFYITGKKGLNEKIKEKISIFVKNICKNKRSDIIVVAGDISHYNFLSQQFLIELSKLYSDVVVVGGNHDWYLVSNNQEGKYGTSYQRLIDMNEFSKSHKGIHYLTIFGDYYVNINGYDFVGDCGTWGDWNRWTNTEKNHYIELFKQKLNDYRYIKPVPFHNNFTNYFSKFSNSEGYLELFNSKIEEYIDKHLTNGEHNNVIFVSHYPINYTNIKPQEIDNFYWMQPSEEIKEFFIDKINIYGHIHDKKHVKTKGLKFNQDQISNALGYPNELRTFNRQLLDFSDNTLKTITF